MTDATSPAYRVLARKYRPTRFDELIGQDALVRTLRNAIDLGRVAHAFVLTGVRGVGKTTTARIIARALNCVGPDGTGGPTAEPCGVCGNCVSIAEDRHVDVIEMDAASRTGIDDIRELIEGVRYRPVSARYKVYIIDEVHMLSRQAFNGLLKTLEEPPEHCIFVFATTEIRKVPITVLSRCQRFDLRRVPLEILRGHFGKVAAAEGVKADDEALTMIARAADGSVRDGLSLLDQAIALAGKEVGADIVRDMLGLADRGAVYDLMEALLSGAIAEALARFSDMYARGADPVIVVQDLLDVTHWLTRVRLAPEIAKDAGVPELEATRGAPMAGRLGMPVLTRFWQMLLKGLQEVQYAPAPAQAVEMLFVRLAFAADLPSPGDLVATLTKAGATDKQPTDKQPTDKQPTGKQPTGKEPGGERPGAAAPATRLDGGRNGARAAAPTVPPSTYVPAIPETRSESAQGPDSEMASGVAPVPGAVASPQPVPAAPAPSAPAPPASADPVPANPMSFEEVVALFAARKAGILTANLVNSVHLVRFSPGRIEMRLTPGAPRDLPGRLMAALGEWTGRRWVVTVSREEGQPTLAEKAAEAERQRLAAAERLPLVLAVKQHFPGARITRVAENAPLAPAASASDDVYGDPGAVEPRIDGPNVGHPDMDGPYMDDPYTDGVYMDDPYMDAPYLDEEQKA